MMKHEDQLAFPSDMSDGMTLRDYFAGQALLGIVTRAPAMNEDAARWAYGYADALLAAREVKP